MALLKHVYVAFGTVYTIAFTDSIVCDGTDELD